MMCGQCLNIVTVLSIFTGKKTAHHFILEYLQMRSFHGQTFDLNTHELVNKYTSLTFPNIAYRLEF